MGFQRGHAANLGCSGAWCVHRVQCIHIKADIGGPIAHHATGFLHHGLNAHGMKFVNVDHPDTLLLAPGIFSIVVKRATNTDLHRPLRVQQAFFHCPAEWRTVGVLETAKRAVPGVGVRVEMHHADWPIFGQRPHDG